MACQNPECEAIALALESAMSDPPKALAALTTIEAKAAEELMGQFDALKGGLQAAIGTYSPDPVPVHELLAILDMTEPGVK